MFVNKLNLSIGRLEGPLLFGQCSVERVGKKKYLQDACDLVKSNAPMSEVASSFSTEFVRHYRGLIALRNTLPAAGPRVPPTVVLYYGPTGCGKSFFARTAPDEVTPLVAGVDFFSVSPPSGSGGIWFDGYDRHSTAIFDDFNGASSHLRLDYLLQLLDSYSMSVPVKGGFVSWIPSTIVITTNVHPLEWYDYSGKHKEHYPALRRRFSRVVTFRRSTGPPPFPRKYLLRDGGEVVSPSEISDWDRFWRSPNYNHTILVPPFTSRNLSEDQYDFMFQ